MKFQFLKFSKVFKPLTKILSLEVESNEMNGYTYFRYNFLLQYQGRRHYKLVDLLRIWRYYDQMGLGYIQADGALVLAFDLLTDVRNRLFLISAMGHDCIFRYLPNIEQRFFCVS